MARQLEGQMALCLYPEEEREYTPESMRDFCIQWLCRYSGCRDAEIRPTVTRLYEEFKPWEAFDRAKVIKAVCGNIKIPGWNLQDATDVLGIFDHGIDYHTCWDRAKAGREGFDKDSAATVIEWDYGKNRPRRVSDGR